MMEAGEVEFVAEKELITITPNFSENKITLISVRGPKNSSYKNFWGHANISNLGGGGESKTFLCDLGKLLHVSVKANCVKSYDDFFSLCDYFFKMFYGV